MEITDSNDKRHTLNYLKHIVHIDNLDTILEYGILSHNEAKLKGFIKNDISMDEVQHRREKRFVCEWIDDNDSENKKSLFVHDFASFYFQSRNTMLYKRHNLQDNLLILLISSEWLNNPNTVYSDGNLGSPKSKLFSGSEQFKFLDWDLLQSDSWNNPDEETKKEQRRKMCAEVLIYPKIEPTEILKIVCNNIETKEKAINIIKRKSFEDSRKDIQVVIDNLMFFKTPKSIGINIESIWKK